MNHWTDALGGDARLAMLAADPQGRRLLLDADLEPSTQEVYTLARANAVSGRTFTEWFVCNMASGDMTGDNGTTLTAGAGTIRYDKTWPGWNGTDMTSGFRAIEFPGLSANDHFIAGDTSTYDLSQSICFVMNIRCLRPPAANRGLIGKRAGSAATNPGYHVQIASAGGAPSFVVCDGSTAVAASISGTYVDGFANGAPHWFAFKVNLTTGRHQVLGYRTSGSEAVTPAGAKTNSTAFRIGGQPFLGSCETLQVLQWGVLVGAEAEAFDIDDLNALDNWCRTPSVFAHYKRASCIAPVVANQSGFGLRVQHCHGSATTTALIHFAHGYSANATSTAGLGWHSERGVTTTSLTDTANVQKRNRLLRTDDLSNASWTKTNVTATANAAEDPGGFTGAASLTASADNGTVHQDYTTELNEIHTHSIFIKRNGVSDVTGRLVAIRTDTSTEIASVAFTATSEWQRTSLEFTAPTTTTRFLVEIDTNGESILATYAQAEQGSLASYQPQQQALVSKADQEWAISNTGNAVYDPDGGRIEVTVCGHAESVPSSGCFIFSTDCGTDGTTFEDRHFIQRDAKNSTEEREVRIYDSTATLVAQIDDLPLVDHRLETTYVSEWDSTATVMGDRRVLAKVNSTTVITGTTAPSAAWTTGTGADRIMPGMRHSFSAHLEGIITRLRIWGRI